LHQKKKTDWMEHKKFAYRRLDELKEDILRAGVELPVAERLDILKSAVSLYGKHLPNRLIVKIPEKV